MKQPRYPTHLSLNYKDYKIEEFLVKKGYSKIEIYRAGLYFCKEDFKQKNKK